MRSFVAALGIAFCLFVGGTAAADDPTPQPPQRQHEILTSRPSGFWTSNRPAVGGAYRWRMLGIGVVLAVGTGVAMWRLVKRANAERARRNQR
ncbi:MAG TPA: hypothetical protein VFQ53_17420 [Kofleriaceae bacterium]|nr:hypothetical protein [Kofleriaceae bacterium]